MKRYLVINGPNLNLLGLREPELYGRQSYSALCRYIENSASELGCAVELFQSNHEGDLIDKIQDAYKKFDGLILNPGGYTHTSVALLDAVLAVGLPAVEVHLTDLAQREDFRKVSYIASACFAHFQGLGFSGYRKALEALLEYS